MEIKIEGEMGEKWRAGARCREKEGRGSEK